MSDYSLAVADGRGRFYPDGANFRVVVTTDTNNIASNKGFIPNVDGTLSCRLRKEAALADLPVLGGVIYPFDIAQVDITGSTATMEVTVLQNL